MLYICVATKQCSELRIIKNHVKKLIIHVIKKKIDNNDLKVVLDDMNNRNSVKNVMSDILYGGAKKKSKRRCKSKRYNNSRNEKKTRRHSKKKILK